MAKILVFFALLVSIEFWSFIYLPKSSIPIICVFLLSCFLIFTKKSYFNKSFIDYIVNWTIITIFLSLIPSIIDYDQDLLLTSRSCIALSYGLFLYFVIKKYHLSHEFLIKIVTTICVIWVLLEILQQFTYPPMVLFSGRYQYNKSVEERLGLYRFYIYGVDFVMMMFAFWLSTIYNNKKINVRAIVLTIIFLVGLLCYGSRKHIYVTIFILLLFVFNAKKKQMSKFQKSLVGLFIILFIFTLYSFFFTSLQKLNEESSMLQGDNEDFIRFLSLKYYLFDFSNSPLYPIFGAGLDYEGSGLRHQLELANNYFGERHGFYQQDIGIFGYYSKFGFFGVSAIILYIVYFVGNWKYIDNWLKYFFIMKIILIVFDFWAIWAVGMMAYSIFLVFLDLNIKKNKKLIVKKRKLSQHFLQR